MESKENVLSINNPPVRREEKTFTVRNITNVSEYFSSTFFENF